jgi:hypothetical protein
LNEPQAIEPQVTDQFTPAPNGSLVTWAKNPFVVLISSELGIAVVKATRIGKATMVRLTLLLCPGLLVTDAVMVMEPLIGAADEAVYTVAAPAAVCVGASVPHAPLPRLPVIGLPAQVTVQSTPAPLLSPTGVILNLIAEPTASELTGPTAPAAFVTEIGPAFAPPDEMLLPQPASIMASTAMQATPHPPLDPIHRVLCWLRRRCASLGKMSSICTCNMTEGSLILSAHSGIALRLLVRYLGSGC